jgi:uncharacterized protein YegL
MNFDPVELINRSARCPSVLLIDTSSALSGSIKELNEALKGFKETFSTYPKAGAAMDLAIMTFDSEVILMTDFAPIMEFEPPVLIAKPERDARLGAGLLWAIQLIDDREKQYRKNGLSYHRPWLLVITKGQATDTDRLTEAANLIHAKRGLHFYVFAIDGADRSILASITQPIYDVKPTGYPNLFFWLVEGQKSVSESGDNAVIRPVPWLDQKGAGEEHAP